MLFVIVKNAFRIKLSKTFFVEELSINLEVYPFVSYYVWIILFLKKAVSMEGRVGGVYL